MRKSLIKKILKGQKLIVEPLWGGLGTLNYNISLKYESGEWVLYNKQRTFPLKDYNKSWWVQ